MDTATRVNTLLQRVATAAARKAGDPDLLHGSLKAAIKHANNAEKTEEQKAFLKAARAYLKTL